LTVNHLIVISIVKSENNLTTCQSTISSSVFTEM